MSIHSFRETEEKWQHRWQQQGTFRAENHSSKPKYYVLDMFPYPSGAGLHVGHPLGYIASDILARYKRHKGFNVLHPMGFDAFGLPAEQYAIQTGQHPALTTEENCSRYRRQLKSMGFSFDWSRELRTSEPAYYKHTQFIFEQLFESWYNKEAGKACPISELVTLLCANGNSSISAVSDENTPKITAHEWNNLDSEKQQAFLLHYRLAYPAELVVNWCPGLGTVLANEEVKDGFSERGGYPVERKQMRQWCLRITAYADRLLNGLDTLDWPEAVKEMQRNWIGRSTGASLKFKIENHHTEIEVFTTRPDTAFGVTFLTLAPEHELVQALTTSEHSDEVEQYVAAAKNRSERDRMSNVKHVTGAFTGSYAINPFNGERIPVWVADYVLAGYGTGAVMAVPSSDTRDYAFAKHFGTKIIQVQQGPGTDISLPDFDPKAGAMINSDFLNGLEVKPAILAAIKYAEEKGFGKARINFRMRDAIFSRQRYWGEPIPVCYKNELPYLLPVSELPLLLPEVDKYLPTETGEPPLGRAKNWHTTEGHPLETNTMPGWAGSSWYFLRYMDPENTDAPFSKQAAEYWNQVDLYIGGAEHATGHLLYARFWTMFLHDLGYISFPEPFKKLVNQGMIQGVSEIAVLKIQKMVNSRDEEERKYQFISADCDPTEFETASEHALMEVHADISMVSADGLDLKAFCNWRKEYADAAFVTPGGFWKGGVFHPYNGAQNPSRFFRTRQEQEKMSKNKFNVVNPDDVIADYNADTLRMYEMFLGPLEQSKPWSTHGIEGTYKFLRKFWRLFFNEHDVFSVSDAEPKPEELRVLHKTIKKVEEDIERLSLNTAVSAFMVCANELSAMRCNKRAVLEPLLVVLSPYAPHLAEELWERLGHTESIAYAFWPQWQEGYVIDDTFECPVSINGKVRVKLTFALNKPIQEIEDEAMAHEAVVKWLEGKLPKKVIVIPNRIVNVVL